jgi:hypothetical protein
MVRRCGDSRALLRSPHNCRDRSKWCMDGWRSSKSCNWLPHFHRRRVEIRLRGRTVSRLASCFSMVPKSRHTEPILKASSYIMVVCRGILPPVSDLQPLHNAHLDHHLPVLFAPHRLSSCTDQRHELYRRYLFLGWFHSVRRQFGVDNNPLFASSW